MLGLELKASRTCSKSVSLQKLINIKYVELHTSCLEKKLPCFHVSKPIVSPSDCHLSTLAGHRTSLLYGVIAILTVLEFSNRYKLVISAGQPLRTLVTFLELVRQIAPKYFKIPRLLPYPILSEVYI